MLNTHSPASAGGQAPPARVFWIDLLNPTAEERVRVARDYGVNVPQRESLQEIETSNRLRAEGGRLYVSMSLALEDAEADFAPLPLGFILSPNSLITVRFADLHAFVPVEASIASGSPSSSTVFVALIEAMVEYDADTLEHLSNKLASLSSRVFGPRVPLKSRDTRISRALHKCLKDIGNAGDHLSRTRESMLGLQRIIAFVIKSGSWWSAEEKDSLGTSQQDLVALVDFQTHLVAKTQFILDATLGFISNQQNEIFRVLTIASVLGIPPTLIASMYGMNFHDMPEYSWRYGYPYGLALILLSILLPIIWFRRQGWW